MPRIQALDLNALMERTRALLARVLDGRVEVRLETSVDLPAVLGEPSRLEQLVLMLGLQGADLLLDQGGGVLTLRALERKDGRCLVEIHRKGPAPAEGKPRRLPPEGLDLHVAELVRDEAEDGGWVLGLLLPEGEPRAAKATSGKPPLEGVRILVAEDEPEMRFFLREILGRMGAEVVPAVDGEEAWKQWNLLGPFHVLLTDHRMPRLTGLELMQRVRVGNPDFPVVIMTGYGREEFEELLAKDTHLRYLAKPFLVRTLVDVVSRLLAGEPG